MNKSDRAFLRRALTGGPDDLRTIFRGRGCYVATNSYRAHIVWERPGPNIELPRLFPYNAENLQTIYQDLRVSSTYATISGFALYAVAKQAKSIGAADVYIILRPDRLQVRALSLISDFVTTVMEPRYTSRAIRTAVHRIRADFTDGMEWKMRRRSKRVTYKYNGERAWARLDPKYLEEALRTLKSKDAVVHLHITDRAMLLTAGHREALIMQRQIV
ncbi:MAG: hypothetical protein DRP09_19005 [Candidatus Thorarchaeota archaeon]|nr:MAG: hypothetical protein DRP09_19005 [Candidatus Thorarchaeota archaeon]